MLKLTRIFDLSTALEFGVVCLTDTAEDGQLTSAYYTRNDNIISSLLSNNNVERTSEHLVNHDSEDHEEREDGTIRAYDLIKKEIVDIHPALFTGHAHAIAVENQIVTDFIEDEYAEHEADFLIDADAALSNLHQYGYLLMSTSHAPVWLGNHVEINHGLLNQDVISLPSIAYRSEANLKATIIGII